MGRVLQSCPLGSFRCRPRPKFRASLLKLLACSWTSRRLGFGRNPASPARRSTITKMATDCRNLRSRRLSEAPWRAVARTSFMAPIRLVWSFMRRQVMESSCAREREAFRPRMGRVNLKSTSPIHFFDIDCIIYTSTSPISASRSRRSELMIAAPTAWRGDDRRIVLAVTEPSHQLSCGVASLLTRRGSR